MKWLEFSGHRDKKEYVTECGEYRIHLYTRGFSAWALHPLSHVGVVANLVDAKALCVAHSKLKLKEQVTE